MPVCKCGDIYDNWVWGAVGRWVINPAITECPECAKKSQPLKPCPFCGGCDLKLSDDQIVSRIECGGCGADGPMNVVGKTAHEMWNLRTPGG